MELSTGSCYSSLSHASISSVGVKQCVRQTDASGGHLVLLCLLQVCTPDVQVRVLYLCSTCHCHFVADMASGSLDTNLIETYVDARRLPAYLKRLLECKCGQEDIMLDFGTQPSQDQLLVDEFDYMAASSVGTTCMPVVLYAMSITLLVVYLQTSCSPTLSLQRVLCS